MPNLMYKFTARTTGKETVSGLIAGRSLNLAHHRIKKIGLTHINLTLDPLESINELFGARANQRQLSMFYRVVGQRLQNGEGRLQSALEQAQTFLVDGRLKSMVAIFHAALEEGQDLNTAMLQGGFEAREAMVVKALSEGAERGQAFISLADEVESRELLRRRFGSMMRMPKFVGGFAYALIPGYVYFISPKTAHFLQQMGNQITISSSITSFYSALGTLVAHPGAFTIGYVALPAAFIYLVRSNWFRLQVERIPTLRDISEKRDHIVLWHSFALMYRGGIPQAEAMRTLSNTVNRADTRRSLVISAKRLASGADEVTAISTVGFPAWSVAGFRGAKLSGDLSEGLLRFSKTLREDLTFALDNLAHYVDIGAVILMGLIVLLLFMVTVYPMTAPILSNL